MAFERLVKNIHMLFTGWEVRTGKIFCRGLKNGPIEAENVSFTIKLFAESISSEISL